MKYLIKIEKGMMVEFDEANDDLAKAKWREILSPLMAGCVPGTVAVLFRVDSVKKTLTFVETARAVSSDSPLIFGLN